MAEETQVFVELTQYSLHALRAVNGTVEAGGECALENKAGLETLLDAVAPSRKADGTKAVATIWPSSVSWYLSTDTEAMLDRTDDSLRAIAAGKQKDPRAALAYAACNAGDGGKVTPEGSENWILAFSSVTALEKASTSLLDLKVDPVDVTPSAFSGIGAVSAALRLEGKGGAVALWDLGAEKSHLLLVTAKGVEAAVPCAVGMDAIIEAVQTALKLKFRGAGARLFFNDTYDFTDPGPRVAAIVSVGLKEALALLPDSPKPPALACLALTGKQDWFVREVASAIGMTPWQPDLGRLSTDMGIKFANGAAASFSAASAGLLGILGEKVNSRDNWNPAWVEAEALAEEIAPTPPEEPEAVAEPEPEPEPAAKPAAAPVRAKPSMSIDSGAGAGSPPRAPRPIVTPKSVTAPPIPAAGPPQGGTRPSAPVMSMRPLSPNPAPAFPSPGGAAAPSFPSPAPAPSFAAPPPAPRTMPAPPAPSSMPAAAAPLARPPSFSNPGFPTLEPGVPEPSPGAPPLPASALGAGVRMGVSGAAAAPAKGVTALPFEAVKLKGLAVGATTPPMAEAPVAAEPKSRVGFYVGVGVVAALLAAVIAVVLEARMERAKANDLAQQEEIAHHKLEQQMEEQEKKAKDDAEQGRKDMEAEVARAKKQAEEDTRREMAVEQETLRVAKLPGTLAVATTPAGASVSIDGAAPLASPVKAGGIAPGSHRVVITLHGFDPVDLAFEIKGSATTDLGLVTLQAIYGSLDLTSTPDGLEFSVRPASDPTGTPVRTGRTPVSAGEIPHGDYLVTFTRPGCRDHVEKVSVTKGVKSPVDTKYQDGSLELTSDPSGATVNKDGDFLGTTPLTLHDLTPKTASFDLTLPGYDSTPISCEIPEGQTLKFSAQLLRKDRIFKASEVKTLPQAIDSPQPVLSAAQRKLGADVVISLVVRRGGLVSDVAVVRATDDDVGRRCKNAVEKWKYRPATAPDDREVDARIEVPFKFPASSQ
jgi:TonB family protein